MSALRSRETQQHIYSCYDCEWQFGVEPGSPDGWTRANEQSARSTGNGDILTETLESPTSSAGRSWLNHSSTDSNRSRRPTYIGTRGIANAQTKVKKISRNQPQFCARTLLQMQSTDQPQAVLLPVTGKRKPAVPRRQAPSKQPKTESNALPSQNPIQIDADACAELSNPMLECVSDEDETRAANAKVDHEVWEASMAHNMVEIIKRSPNPAFLTRAMQILGTQNFAEAEQRLRTQFAAIRCCRENAKKKTAAVNGDEPNGEMQIDDGPVGILCCPTSSHSQQLDILCQMLEMDM